MPIVLTRCRFFLCTLLMIVTATGCSGNESASEPIVEPTATAVPVVFDSFFSADAPLVSEPVWYETEPPEHWPTLIPLPRTLDMTESSFVDFIRTSGDREITGRLHYDSAENYPDAVRDHLLDLGFTSVKYFENRAGSVALLQHGRSTAEVLGGPFGYTMLIISESPPHS